MSRTPSKSKKTVKTTKTTKTRRTAKKGPGKGWHDDPVRHRLARYGISTTLPDGRRLDVSKFLPARGIVKRLYGVDEKVTKLFDIAREEGVPEDKQELFVQYYLTRGFTMAPAYVREWAQRFARGSEYARSDSEGRVILERLDPVGYEPGFQDRGAIPGEPGGGREYVAHGLTTTDVMRLNEQGGGYFFSPETMRFFKSRVLHGPLHKDRFFITSEMPPHGGRRYKIREFHADDADITTVEGSYATAAQARKAMEGL